MKRLTVDQTWEQCLAMWKWIDWHVARGDTRSVFELKDAYIEKFNPPDVGHDCFFCAYSNQFPDTCVNCPGALVDEDFSCHHDEHSYIEKPRRFYAELKRLNKIRLSRKTK